VNNYNSQLSKLNDRMDKALEQVGGSTRMILLVFGMIICLVLMVVLYIVFEVYLKPYLDKTV
jgi:tetrahydromethanopterin S-methyltransferase subunit F